MLLYVRHGDDRGDDAYRHDRRLIQRGKEKAIKKAARLIERYGHPNVAYVSPYRRAIDTLEAMSKRFEARVEVRRDPRVAQHLSEKQRRDPKVHPETSAVVPIEEDAELFRRRVARHVEEARREGRSGSVVWCVTHQVVIEEVARHFDVEISDDLDFLDHVVMLR